MGKRKQKYIIISIYRVVDEIKEYTYDRRMNAIKKILFFLSLSAFTGTGEWGRGGGGYIGGEARERRDWIFFLSVQHLSLNWFFCLSCLLEAYHLWGGDGGFKRTKSIDSFLHYIHGQEGTIKKRLPPKKTGAPIIIQFKKKTLSSKLHKNKHLNRDD